METPEDSGEIVSSIYKLSAESIQMALALTVALAWYSFIKCGIISIWPHQSDKLWALGGFAVVATVLFVLVLFFIKNVLKVPVTGRNVMYAIAPTL